MLKLLLLSLLLCSALAQQSGGQKQNAHPQLPWEQCTKVGGCASQQGAISIDSNWDWTHKLGTYTNCYQGNEWDPTLCPDAVTCAKNCALDAGSVEQFKTTYGISTEDDALSLQFVTSSPNTNGKNVGSRTYLYNEAKGEYQMFTLKNREFSFDVDVSKLPCGLNGALYFVQMDADGGLAKFPGNNAGANFGTGYCDAQCPHDIKFINGEANFPWTSDPSDPNKGTGHYGTCCTEMDIWESNSMATQLTPHVCTVDGQTRCEGKDCGDVGADREAGVCDKDGCDWNPYRLGSKDFYGPGANYTIDTSQKFSVVTQFITSDGTDRGDLTEIRRFYLQNGKQIEVPKPSLPGVETYSSITDEFCHARSTATNDTNGFAQRGGLKKMGEQAEAGMVLVMSLWDDGYANMLWLDSSYPLDQDPSAPGVTRGPCSTSSGKPADVEEQSPDATVIYSNIRYGEVGSTTGGSPSPPTPPAPPSPPTAGCNGCGYACHGSCSSCGRCNTKPGCMSKDTCMTNCNSGGNAMWCGGSTPTPPTPPAPPAPPTPSGCPGGSLSGCIGLCPSTPPVAFQACVQDCTKRCA